MFFLRVGFKRVSFCSSLTNVDGFSTKAELEGSSNEDGNVNKNAPKQWIKLQNTITARGNAATWPLFRRHL